MDPELRVALALIVSRLEGLREEIGVANMLNISKDLGAAGVVHHEAIEQAGDIYSRCLKRARQEHKIRRLKPKRKRKPEG